MALGTNLGILASVTSTPVFSNTYSLDFDGVDDYVDTGITNTGTNDVSISCWIKTTETFGYLESRCAFGGYNNGSGANYTLGRMGSAFSSPDDMKVRVFNTLGTTKLNDGNWHNIIYTYDYSTKEVKAYVDGNTTPEATATFPAFNSNYRIAIGWNGFNITYSFQGNIDECAYWDSIISTSDITSIYNLGLPSDLTDLSPIAWYRMGDNGSYKSPQWLIPSNENNDKVSNYSFDFDGVDDYVDCGDSDDFSFGNGTTDSPFSISAWIKMDDASAFRVATKYVNANREYLFTTDTSDRLSFALYDNSNGSRIQRKYNTALTSFQGQWINVIGTYDGSSLSSGIKIYLNGTRVDDIDGNLGTYIAMENTTQPLEIGRRDVTSFSNGKIDEWAIFNTELSSADALAIYNGGEPTTLPSGAVAHYKMGEEANFTSNWLVDNSALSNYSKRSFDFDGVDDYLSVSDNSIGQTQNISYSIWVNLDVTTRQYIIGNQNSSNGGCGLQIESGDVLVFQMADGTNDSFFNSRVASFSTYAPINTWNHILATWDGTDSKIYINGVLRNTWTPTLPYTISGYDTTFNIGWRAAGFSLMTNGKLDELALFNTAISIGDVWDGSGQPIDVSAVSGLTNNWRMGEDASFNGTNWTVPDNLGTSTGTSANMTVDSLVGEAANYSGGGISNAMTIEDRVGNAPSSSNNAISFNMESVDRTTDVPI